MERIVNKVRWFFKDIPWNLRKAKYRRQLWKKMKVSYEAPWDLAHDTLVDFLFIPFCEYYKKYAFRQFKNGVRYGSETEEEAAERFNEITELYIWYKLTRNLRKDNLEKFQEQAHAYWKEKMYSVPIEDKPDLSELLVEPVTDRGRMPIQIVKAIHNMEHQLWLDDSEMMNRLIKYRGSLWD